MTVYFVQDGGPGGHIKIGYTAGNPHSRIASFRTGNPRPLALLVAIPGEPEDERALHKRFGDLRESGEWFRADARLLGFIEGMQHAYPEQPKDPGPSEEPVLFGLTADQVDAMAGFTWATDVLMRAASWCSRWLPADDYALDASAFDDGVKAMGRLDALKQCTAEAEKRGGTPFDDGAALAVATYDETHDASFCLLGLDVHQALDRQSVAIYSEHRCAVMRDCIRDRVANNGGSVLLSTMQSEFVNAEATSEEIELVIGRMTAVNGGHEITDNGSVAQLRRRHSSDVDRWVGFGWTDERDEMPRGPAHGAPKPEAT